MATTHIDRDHNDVAVVFYQFWADLSAFCCAYFIKSSQKDSVDTVIGQLVCNIAFIFAYKLTFSFFKKMWWLLVKRETFSLPYLDCAPNFGLPSPLTSV